MNFEKSRPNAVDKRKAKPVSRRSEIFKRIGPNALVSMILQSADGSLNEEEIAKLETQEHSETTQPDQQQTTKRIEKHSSLEQFVRGVGEIDMQANYELPLNDNGNFSNKPYLLLDVRLEEEYKAERIITALNFPYTLLSRAVHVETGDMRNYKNRPGKRIVVYDQNEKQAHKVVETLIQRGYDNVLLLTGGLSGLLKKYPSGIATGHLGKAMRRSATIPLSRPIARGFPANVQDDFTNADLQMLQDQLTHNLKSRISKSRLMRPTTSGTFRNQQINSQRQTSNAKASLPWK